MPLLQKHHLLDVIYNLFVLQNCTIELFRLNENTLWYEVLVNPEACCMKWASEADYIMPILTPKFLREIHGQISGIFYFTNCFSI